MSEFRLITQDEIKQLKLQRCYSQNWNTIFVKDGFGTERIWDTEFSGEIKLGLFHSKCELPGGVKKQSGLCKVKLHNVAVGDNTCIENIHNYIANYDIGEGCIIENVDRKSVV